MGDGGPAGRGGSTPSPGPPSLSPAPAVPAASEPAVRIRLLLDRILDLDPSPYVVGPPRADLQHRIAAPMLDVVDQALALVQQVEPWSPAVALDDEVDLAFGPHDAAAPGPQDGPNGPDDTTAAYCFALRHELEPVRRQLADPDADHEQILVACDRARRKLRRSLSALAGAVAGWTGQHVALQETWVDRAGSAVAVRTLYAKFRWALFHGPDGSDPGQVSRAMRRAATALAVLCGDEDFSEVRIQDRLLLRSLQRRTLAWGRAPDAKEGLRLHGDLRAAAELLRSINMRQELLAHDAQLVNEVSHALERRTPADPSMESILGRMRALLGLDDELDAILRGAYGGTPLEQLHGPLQRVLNRLHSSFHGAGTTHDR